MLMNGQSEQARRQGGPQGLGPRPNKIVIAQTFRAVYVNFKENRVQNKEKKFKIRLWRAIFIFGSTD